MLHGEVANDELDGGWMSKDSRRLYPSESIVKYTYYELKAKKREYSRYSICGRCKFT